MYSLILAAETANGAVAAHPGDEFTTLALAMFAAALLITAVTTAVVTPGRDHH